MFSFYEKEKVTQILIQNLNLNCFLPSLIFKIQQLRPIDCALCIDNYTLSFNLFNYNLYLITTNIPEIQ